MVEPISQEDFEQMWNDDILKKSSSQNDTIGMVTLHYTDWCGFSLQMLPEWEKFEEYCNINLKILRVEKINYGLDKKPPVSLDIIGYPTIILQMFPVSQETYETSLNDKPHIKFYVNHHTDRTCRNFINFVTPYIQEYHKKEYHK